MVKNVNRIVGKMSEPKQPEKLQSDKPPLWAMLFAWFLILGVAGFILYVLIEFIKFCVWLGAYTWP